MNKRSFASGLVLGLTIALAIWAFGFYHPERPRPLVSYAQQGEDVLTQDVLRHFFGVTKPTYIDIGAYDPINSNNTYLFYELGSHGVLVEPNPALVPKLRKARPRDTVLEIGIGASGEDEEVDYYILRGNGELNTFSKESATEHGYEKVIKRKLVNVNKVIAENFGGAAPDFFSVDTEGFDLTILKSLDLERFRPKVVCAETLKADDSVEREIVEYMQSKDYEIRGATFVNTIFVDRRALAKRYGWKDK